MRTTLILAVSMVSMLSYGVTVNVNPRGDNQGSVGTTTRRWSEMWGMKLGIGDTNYYVTAIETNITAGSTHNDLPTSEAVWDIVQGVSGTVSAADSDRWDEAYTWVTNNGPRYVNWDAVYNWYNGTSFGTSITKDFIGTYPPATPGDNGKLTTWYVVKEYVDDNTGTNVVSTNDRDNWNEAYSNSAAFFDVTVDPARVYSDMKDAWGWAWNFNTYKGDAWTYYVGAVDDKLPNWQQVTNYVATQTGTNTVTEAERANWNSAYSWTSTYSNDVDSLISKSYGWDSNYTWYVTSRGDAADRDMAVGSVPSSWSASAVLDYLNVRTYVEAFTATGVVTSAERDRWDDTWTEVYDGHPDGNGTINGINYTNWDYTAGWLITNEAAFAYMLTRTSIWDSATAPNLDTVMSVGNWTTNSILYTNVDFTISNSEGTNGGMRDVVIKAGASADGAGPFIELTGANNDGQGDGENNGWVEVHLRSGGQTTSPRVLIADDSGANRELEFWFNGDEMQIAGKDDVRIWGHETNSYIRISDGANRIHIYSENNAKLMGANDVTIEASSILNLKGDLGLVFDLGGGYTPEFDNNGHFDLNEVDLQNGLVDCFTTDNQMDFVLPTADPGVSYRLWSSNGVVHYTGAP